MKPAQPDRVSSLRRCPVCDTALPGSPLEYPDFPFCSKRCRTIDLGRWLGEEYTIGSQSPDISTEPEERA